MFFYTPEEVRRIEKNETENGLSSLEMIENAAAALYDRFKECFGANRKPMRVLVLCGKGNNGADGYAFAMLLKKDGIFTEILSVNTGTQSSENRFFSQNAAVLETKPDFSKYDCIADGVYGSGFTGELPEEIGNLFDDIRRSAVPVFAIDLPSGVHGADGTVSPHALRADFTVNLTARKVGSYVFPGAGLCGKVFLGAELPAPPSSFKDGFLPLSRPSGRTNKGTFGTVGVVGGGKNMAGAAFLAGKAAYLSGAGLVKLFTPECNRSILQTLLPEATLYTYDDQIKPEELLFQASRCTALVLGPGLGQGKQQKELVKTLLDNLSCPLVLDADGLNLSACRGFIEHYQGPLVLTPHPGEALRLSCGERKTIKEITDDPLHTLEILQKKYRCTVLLKDAHTLISDGRSLAVNLTGNSGMSKGGNGDVLSGIIGALLAQGLSPFKAACAGAYYHGLAGDLAAKKHGQRSLLATHVLEELPSSFLLAFEKPYTG